LTKRHKDLLDIERLIETQPRLRSQVPASILEKIEEDSEDLADD
jgi:hypothetical protein